MSVRSPSPPRPEVTVLRWPAQDDVRRRLAAGPGPHPRLLLVPVGVLPPALLDDLEDWVREPAEPHDRAARIRNLARRAAARGPLPEVDADGLLRHDGRWVAIPERQLAVVRLLVDHVGRVVRVDALRAAYEAAGGSGHPSSLRTLVARIGRRAAAVGLRLETIRGRGVMLEIPPSC